MDFVTCFAINVAQLTNLREQIHIAQIVFKDYNELLVFWIKYFKNSICVCYVFLFIYNLFALVSLLWRRSLRYSIFRSFNMQESSVSFTPIYTILILV